MLSFLRIPCQPSATADFIAAPEGGNEPDSLSDALSIAAFIRHYCGELHKVAAIMKEGYIRSALTLYDQDADSYDSVRGGKRFAVL